MGDPQTSGEHTFVFADLAGYTALTEAHGDEAAADIALEFCREVNRRLPTDAEDLKMLGDACLLRVQDAPEAVTLGLQLTGELARRHGFPDVRVGMHTGGAARRGSEWFGSTLNIAARISAIAGPCEVLLSSATKLAANDPAGVEFEDRGSHQLRHVSQAVHLYRAQYRTTDDHAEDWTVDPVCHMRIAISRAAATVDRAGTRSYFCSESCAAVFVRSPNAFGT